MCCTSLAWIRAKAVVTTGIKEASTVSREKASTAATATSGENNFDTYSHGDYRSSAGLCQYNGEIRYGTTFATTELMRASNPNGGESTKGHENCDQDNCTMCVLDTERKHVESCWGQGLGSLSEDTMLNFKRCTEHLRMPLETLRRRASNNIVGLSRSCSKGNHGRMRRRYFRQEFT